MQTNREIHYRTLQQVIDSASIDLSSWYTEGVVETAELIGIIQEINWELGIQIQETRETVLDIGDGRTKLPNNFDFLNFGFICSRYTQAYTTQSLTQYEVPYGIPSSPNLTTCPCWRVENTNDRVIQTKYTDCNGDEQALTMQPVTTISLCALVVTNPNAQLIITTDKNCYASTLGTFSCDIPQDCGCNTPLPNGCTIPNYDPWNQNRVYTICNDTIGIRIYQPCETQILEYSFQQPLYLQPSRTASAFCSNSNMKTCAVNGFLRDNHIITPNLNCGTIYINYQALLEDDDGNLLAIDHPKLNQYYNYAVKERILENLYLNGEPDIERRLQLVQQKKQEYKGQAMVLAYTPDFRTIVNTYQKIRKDANEQHTEPFSRFTGPNAYTSWIDRWVNGRYRN